MEDLKSGSQLVTQQGSRHSAQALRRHCAGTGARHSIDTRQALARTGRWSTQITNLYYSYQLLLLEYMRGCGVRLGGRWMTKACQLLERILAGVSFGVAWEIKRKLHVKRERESPQQEQLGD